MCIAVDARERCGLVPTLRDGWQLLIPDPGVPRGRFLAGLAWLGLPALLAGMLLGGRLAPTALVAAATLLLAALAASRPGVALATGDLVVPGVALAAGGIVARLRAVRPEGRTR